MHVSAERLAAHLNALPARLRAIPEDRSLWRYGPGKWSKRELLGHLIDSAVNNHQRFLRAQQTDKLVFPPYDQDFCVRQNAWHDRSWADLVTLWEALNRQLVVVLDRIPPEDYATPCVIGPGEPGDLELLMIDYVDHLEYHMGQIVEEPVDATTNGYLARQQS